MVGPRWVWVNHANVNGQAPPCLPGWDENVCVSFQIACCRLFSAMWDGAGLQTPAQERLNAEVSLPELIPFAAYHVVPEGVHRCATCQGTGDSFKRRRN